MWEEKPLIMADPAQTRDTSCDSCTGDRGCEAACQGIGNSSGTCEHPGSTDPSACCICYEDVPPINDFFTFRTPIPGYFDGPTGPNQWGWLEIFPQHAFYSLTNATEQMVVGVAQNATNTALAPMSLQNGIHGRSWHNGARDMSENAGRQGFNFQEQWDRALLVDPSFVFVTGWNEWVAGRFDEWAGVGGGAVFPDQFDHEYSRDIEPMLGGHGDDYYYQLMANIREYKGVRRQQRPSPPRTVMIDGSFENWQNVLPIFRDTQGDTAHRDAPGYGNTHYTNTSGRNDFVESRVTWDSNDLFFYVQTASQITPRDENTWMVLLIDSDNDRSTGWRGYEYTVNLSTISDTETNVLRIADQAIIGSVPLAFSGTEMELSVPRSMIEQTGEVAFTFHWADNVTSGEDIPEFGPFGDNAPNRRASYLFAPW